MKRILSIAFAFIYFIAIFLSLIIFIKPGASVFYKKTQINPQLISYIRHAYEVEYKTDQYIYNPETLLLLEDGRILNEASRKHVLSGKSGTSVYEINDEKSITIYFSPFSSSNPTKGEQIISVAVRPYFISKAGGGIAFLLLIFGFLAISIIDPQNRRSVLKSPVGIFNLWVNGDVFETIKKWIQKIEINELIHNILIPILVLMIYCITFSYFSNQNDFIGVNYHFVNYLWRYLGFIALFLFLFIFIYSKQSKISEFKFSYLPQKFPVADFILILFPLTPVVQYIINNFEFLSFGDVLNLLVYFCLFSILFVLIIPYLLNITSSNRILVAFGLAFASTITNMASVSLQFSWYETGSFWIQIAFFFVVYLLTRFVNKKVLYIFILINFVVNSGYQILTNDVSKNTSTLSINDNELRQVVENKQPKTTPNIYLLIYDSYVPNEVMLEYGIDNSTQESYLAAQGFKLYPHTYSVASTSIESIGRVLNASTELYGGRRNSVAGDGIVQNTLKKLGYSTRGIFYSGYLIQDIGSSYDFTIPMDKNVNNYLKEGIILGEFRFDLSFYEQSHTQFRQNKIDTFENIPDNPIFTYVHTNRPNHSQKSGVCSQNAVEEYEERLIAANEEMGKDLEVVLREDPTALVIVAGDHGPYVEKNCASTTGVYDISEISRLDIQDRFSTFLAIKWPTEDYEKYDDITILQDLFPAIYAYMYDDVSILQSKIKPRTIDNTVSGAYVENGIIFGGVDDGEALFLSQ